MKNAFLKFIARKIIKKYKPLVIGVTGSVGKTSTKEAIYTVLKQKFSVFRSVRNLNTESGLPISVMAIGEIPSGKWQWRFAVLKRAFQMLFTKLEYPRVLILEYGADKPGDIEYLLSVVTPDIAVLTAVAPTHLESFGSVEEVKREKIKLLESTKDPQKRFINADLVEYPNGVSYGVVTDAHFKATDIVSHVDPVTHVVSTLFKIYHNGSVVPCELSGLLGSAYVLSSLAAVAVGKALGLNVVDAVQGLKDFRGLLGHMRILGGVKHTTIVDDTYNSSPVAAKHAIETTSLLEGFGRKWVVLGDMLELGSDSVKYHREIGAYVSQQSTVNSQQNSVIARSPDNIGARNDKIIFLVTVGERARDIARGAKDAGMNPDHVFDFADTPSAGRFLQDRIEHGDLILVKGSQGMRMERVVRELMAEPQRADELLVRRSFGV